MAPWSIITAMSSLKHYLSVASLSAALIAADSCLAVSFLSFDARSISMGGAGVVTARSHNASLFNPALLINHDKQRHTRLHIHTYAGARLADAPQLRATTKMPKHSMDEQVASTDSYPPPCGFCPPGRASTDDA